MYHKGLYRGNKTLPFIRQINQINANNPILELALCLYIYIQARMQIWNFCLCIYFHSKLFSAHYTDKLYLQWFDHFFSNVFIQVKPACWTSMLHDILKLTWLFVSCLSPLFISYLRCLIFPCPWMKTKATLSLKYRFNEVNIMIIPRY